MQRLSEKKVGSLPLPVRLSGVFAVVDDDIGECLLLAVKVVLEDLLCAVRIAQLGVDGGARHMGDPRWLTKTNSQLQLQKTQKMQKE